MYAGLCSGSQAMVSKYTAVPRSLWTNTSSRHQADPVKDLEPEEPFYIELCCGMDYISQLEVALEKDYFYNGETITGQVLITNTQSLKVRGISLYLRGVSRAECRVVRGGERGGGRGGARGGARGGERGGGRGGARGGDHRILQDEEVLLDDTRLLWGHDKSYETSSSVPVNVSILPPGSRALTFTFTLPHHTQLPCSFESKMAVIRYYLHCVVDMPYASDPETKQYFTVIGPDSDVMEEDNLEPVEEEERMSVGCLCRLGHSVRLRCTLNRSAFCCGEQLGVVASLENKSQELCWVTATAPTTKDTAAKDTAAKDTTKDTTVTITVTSPSELSEASDKQENITEEAASNDKIGHDNALHDAATATDDNEYEYRLVRTDTASSGVKYNGEVAVVVVEVGGKMSKVEDRDSGLPDESSTCSAE